jgi:cellobiose-specific phosphotransferase system component IIB
MRHLSFITSLTLILIVACGGSSPALISQSEIQQAKKNGNLMSLYNKADDLANKNSGSTQKEAIALRSSIAAMLVDEKKHSISYLLEQHKTKQNVTRQDLLEANKDLNQIQQWSATDYALLKPQVDYSLKQVNQSIQQLVEQSKDEEISLVESILKIKQAAELAGKKQPETNLYQVEYTKVLAQLADQANQAASQNNFENAIHAAEQGLQLDPGNIQFESILSQAQAGSFEKQFQLALESGQPESAYQALIEVSDKPIFLQLKKSFNKNILLLANYFAASAKKDYSKKDLYGAYQNFIKARTIQQKLSVAQLGFIEEKRFLDLVMAKARSNSYQAGERQSLMRIVSEFDPSYPGMRAEYLKLADEVKSRAMTKLAVSEFKEVVAADPVVSSVGRRIASKLEQTLFQQLGNEVSIISSKQAVSQQSSPNNNYSGLKLNINGEVLQAAIEQTTNRGQRSINVVTGVDRVETEEYQQWAKRKRGEQPKQYHETPIKEDVVLQIEHQKKIAIAEVAFRIVEPATGQILLTDSLVKESQHKGTSINEFQKGDFHQPYESAALPSNIKVMDNLSSELAKELGDRLGQYLQSPEQVFYQKYQHNLAQNNTQDSIELLANAIAIAESKGSDISLWYQQLKQLVLSKK